MNPSSFFSPHRIFWVFAITHVLLWTLVPSLSRHELDSDSMMHFAWGQEWMGSYHLHPPVLPWIVAGFLKVFGISNWTYNFLTQLNFLIAFYCVWRISRELLPPLQAVAAVCLLEFIPYFSFFSMRLNHSSMLIPMWAATVLFAYLSIEKGYRRYWIALGITAALAMLTKYYSAALLPGIAIYLLVFSAGRATLKTSGPYLSLVTFCAIMGWHIWYVQTNEMSTITHIGDYIAKDFWIRISGLRFLGAQLLYLTPLLGVYFFVRSKISKKIDATTLTGGISTAGNGRTFVLWIFLFPLLTTAIIGFVAGIGVSSRWGGPTLNLAGVVLLMLWPIVSNDQAVKRLLQSVGTWLLAAPLLLLFTGLASSDHEMYHFPGKELGEEITKRWREKYDAPLRIVGGGHVAPDSIAFHSPDHPSVLQHLSHTWSPWVTEADIKRYGIAVVCLREDRLCIKNAAILFPNAITTPLTIRARSTIFFPGSQRDLLYFFVGPNDAGVDLNNVTPLPRRNDETDS
ncbi:glycosyltransferase family 39 protein [Arenicellales bacterium nBUS_48]